MIDTIVTIVLVTVPILLLIKTTQDWRQSKNHWYVLPIIVFLFAILDMLADWWSGFLAALFGWIIYIVIRRTAKK